MKNLSLSILFLFISSTYLFAQDIKDIAGKMSFHSNLPTPRFIIDFPDSVNGISIVYEDFHSITAEKLEKLKKVELVELRFSNQLELDKEVALLPNFPAMKYLILSDWEYGSKSTNDEIKLPEVLASYTNIKGLKISGDLKINFQQGLTIFKELPRLQYLFLENFNQPIPDVIKSFKQLKGISLQSTGVVSLLDWITELRKLESISLSMVNYNNFRYLDYSDALKKLQKLPFIKSLYLYHVNPDSNFDNLKFDKLTKIALDGYGFKGNTSLLEFLTKHEKLRSIRISGSSPEFLGTGFSKLKQLSDLSIIGKNDSLSIHFNLKDLKSLKSLEISNLKLFLNQSAFPDDLVRLNLSGTKMTDFPLPIIKLHQLKTLTLNYTKALILPDNFSDLKQLEHLDLSSTGLKELPETFGALRNLLTLKLNANPISELPVSLGDLKNLRVLELWHGNLKELPSSIGGLEKLESMNITDNFIAEIPESIINVKTLKTLNLSHNQLVALPQEIGNLSALEVLTLDFNNIKRIPKSIGSLQSLKKINFSFNDLDSLPEQINKHKSLEELYLSSGKIEDAKQQLYSRKIYRTDDPTPNKKITVNRIKNFPEDLSKWTLLKKLYLSNNSEINKEQLWKGLFSIPSKEYSLHLVNCGIDILPDKGWERFFVKSLDISTNLIEEIPANIRLAPYLSEINVNRNRLQSSPVNLNQSVTNSYEKALWFTDLGIILRDELPRTDGMVLALVNKSSNHFYRKEYKQAVELANTAMNINDRLAMTKISLTNMGEANYEVGNYHIAINYLSRAILRDTAGHVRIMNFVIPDFEYRAKSYLKLGDTLSAIKDYETLANNFSDSWGEVGLLYHRIHQQNEANTAFEQGIKKYQKQIDYYIKTNQPTQMQQLSRLELMIIKEDFERAINYAVDLEKDFKSIEHITLLRYLKAAAEIANNTFNRKSKPELLDFLMLNKKSISGWGYDLFDEWLGITAIPKEREKLLRQITDHIKP